MFIPLGKKPLIGRLHPRLRGRHREEAGYRKLEIGTRTITVEA